MEIEDVSLQAEISGSEDEGDDERKHNQLVDAISSLDGKKRHKLSQRTVLTNQISEYNFSTSGDGGSKVQLYELVGALKDSAKHGALKKQLNIVKKRKKIVSVPLPKHEKQKIDRTVAYESTSKDVSKWDSVVNKNRMAEQIHFPLQKPDFTLATTDDFIKRFQLRTPLEMQVAALLQGSDHVIQDKQQELSPAEQRALRAMDIEEARERRAELMRYKALLSYKEAKARWRNKIKSKRYHRMLKKDRLKQEKKALDDLEKNDPESYAEKIKQLDKDRIEERMSLKHRGGSKYAKKQMLYAKYDDKAREQVQDMLQKSREITRKLEVDEDSGAESEGGVSVDSEDENAMLESQLHSEKEVNPWMQKMRPTKKDNPWMAKPVLKTDSVYSRPDEFKDEIEELDNDSETEKDENMDKEDEIRENVENATKIVTTFDSGVENSLTLEKDDDSIGDNEAERDTRKDEIDEIFSHGHKKSVINKKEGKKKAKRLKKNKKKQKRLVENSVNNEQTDKSIETEIDISSKKTETKATNEDIADSDDDLISEGLSRKRTLEEIEDSGSDVDEPKRARAALKKEESQAQNKTAIDKDAYVDPKKLFTLDAKLKQVGRGPDLVDDDEDDVDPEEQQRMTIAQAFADDDVIEEFRKDKEEDIDKNKLKDLDFSLPGWGDWGGSGITMSKKKKKRFIIKAPPAPVRRDSKLGNVIINEQKAATVRKHQVHELPFPFANVDQFEKSIRAPLGKTWNPETAHRELVKPKVVTRLGKIITPIDKSEVYKNAKKKDIKTDMGFNDAKNKHKRPVTQKKHFKDKKSKKKGH